MSVLIIEDDSLWAVKLQHTVESLGLNVITIASSLEETRLLLEVQTPDLIIADVYLRDGKIFSLYKASKYLEIPTIFVTVSANQNDYKHAKRLRSFAFLVKPFHHHTLSSAINLIMSKQVLEKNAILEAEDNKRQINGAELKKMYTLLGDERVIGLFNLDEREQEILRKYWYELKPMSVIAKELKVSWQRVQRMYGKIIGKIKTKIVSNARHYKLFLEVASNKNRKLLLLEQSVAIQKKNVATTLQDADFSISIDSIAGFPTKWANILRERNIKTITDLVQYSKKELLRFRNIGPFVVLEIEKMLAGYGLKLKE